MQTFFMFGKYSSDSIKGISKERTRTAVEIIQRFGGKVNFMYALLGAYDLVVVAAFEDLTAAVKASVEITKATGVSFSTLPAIPVEEFDDLVGKV